MLETLVKLVDMATDEVMKQIKQRSNDDGMAR